MVGSVMVFTLKVNAQAIECESNRVGELGIWWWGVEVIGMLVVSNVHCNAGE